MYYRDHDNVNIVFINYHDSIHVVLCMRILYKCTCVNCFYTCVFSCKNFNSCTTSVMMAGSSSRLVLAILFPRKGHVYYPKISES